MSLRHPNFMGGQQRGEADAGPGPGSAQQFLLVHAATQHGAAGLVGYADPLRTYKVFLSGGEWPRTLLPSSHPAGILRA